VTRARVNRAPIGCLAVTLALGAILGFGGLHRPLNIESVEGRQADPTAVVQKFADALNRGDASGAAELFSDTGTLKGIAVCRNSCIDKADIQSAFATNWVPYVPGVYTIEQVCGDTVVVLLQGINGSSAPVGSGRWSVVTFRTSAGRIAAMETLYSSAPSIGFARAAAVQACGGQYVPASPAPFNKGGLFHIDTRISLWLGAVLAGVVATVLIACLLYLVRCLKRPA
jgi:hypothetical protein